MKRIGALLLVVGILVSMLVPICASGWGLSNFTKINSYYAGRFSDVSSSAWYAENVASVYELGLMEGISGSEFSPQGNITEAEALTIAARLHKIYTTGNDDFSEVRDEMWEMEPTILEWTGGDTNSPGYKEFFNSWYSVYAYYLSNYTDESSFPLFPFLGADPSGAPFINANRPISRSLFVFYLAHALPEEALQQINNIENGAIPDVSYDSSPETYLLYRAGVLNGSDEHGTFRPDSYISRAEVAAIVTRMADASLRKKLDLSHTGSISDKIDIAAAYYSGSNSVNGVSMGVYWRNNTGKTINYIHFLTRVYDLNGNMLSDEISGKTLCDCYAKGPFAPYETDGYYYIGSYEISGITVPSFALTHFDKDIGRYNYSFWDEKLYIAPENEEYLYNESHWSAFMYNGRAASVGIDEVLIEYSDGTQERIYSPNIGVKNSVEIDRAFTVQMEGTFVCPRCGKETNVHDTDIVNNVCKECYDNYKPEVTILPIGLPQTTELLTIYDDIFSFTITNVDVEVSGFINPNGEPCVTAFLDIHYEFTDLAFLSNFGWISVEMTIKNRAGEVVYLDEFLIENDILDWESVTIEVPDKDIYYISFNVTQD